MVKCFICHFNFEDPREVCEHIKKHHNGIASYKCPNNTTCRSSFTALYSYRRHLDSCCKTIPSTFKPENELSTQDSETRSEMKNFEKKMEHDALAFVCKLASNMSVPRNHTYEVISDFQVFLSSTILEGFIQHVKPKISREDLPEFDYFMQICRDPFRSVKTEHRLDSVLEEADLIRSSITFDISEEQSSEEGEECSNRRGTLMPLAFQFKKFFELPGVFETTQKYSEEVSQSVNVCHFINGEVWKEKLKSYQPNETVIPFHLHMDETQINNALGSHRSVGLETCTYYSFPTVPPQFNSRLENIFVAQLCSADAYKECGNFACFSALIDALNDLAHVPITLNINGEEKEVYFAVGLFLGDNKGLNDQCGFAKSHRAKYFCRFCRLSKEDTEKATREVLAKLRNIENYEEDLKICDSKKTGIMENSFVNSIFLCHATVCLGIDMMHDVFEGILHYNLCEVILALIADGYCSLDMLNKLKADLNYGDVEAGDKSPPITEGRLQSRRLLMSASEMQSFAHHFTLIVGDLIPRSKYRVWKFLLQTMKFVDLLFLPSYNDRDLTNLTATISTMNEMYMKIFQQSLKPKHHYVTHYPTMIRRFGPLYYISSMRYEAKHKDIKNYTKNTSSRRLLSYSIARKIQYNFSSRLLNGIGLIDKINLGPSKHFRLSNSQLREQVQKSQVLQDLFKKKLMESSKATVNGIKFSDKLYITLTVVNKMTLLKIESIVFSAETVADIFFVCRVFDDVFFNEHYQCYEVKAMNEAASLKLVSLTEVLKERRSPVSVHYMANNKIRFRAKSF